MSTAALFTVAERWKQLSIIHPQWIDKQNLVYTFNLIVMQSNICYKMDDPYIVHILDILLPAWASNKSQMCDSDPSGMWIFVHSISLATETSRGTS